MSDLAARAPARRAPSLALALAAALVVGVPAAGVAVAALAPSPAWDHVRTVLLAEYAATTLFLVVAGAAGATLIGAPLAWLVAATRFPGRDVLAWALVLPLALPTYVAAYAYADLTGVAGPVQGALRAAGVLTPGSGWFARVSGAPGAAFVYAVTLFPYVYLAARAAFAMRSVCAMEAARTLGAGAWAAFWRVALPLARPAIAAGAALAAMEIAAEYGAAAHLGAPSLAVGVFRVWQGMGDLSGAARLAAVLAIGALILLAAERAARGRAAYAGGSTRFREPRPARLLGLAGAAATGACVLALLAGFVLPVGHLIGLGLRAGPPLRDLAGPLVGSVTLAALGAAAALAVAGLAAAAGRLGGRSERALALTATFGYAAPGAVVAIGLLGAASAAAGGAFAALAGPAAIVMLAWAYAARFTAAGYGPLEAGLQRVTPSMTRAARSLGAGPARRFLAVEAPIAAPGLLAGALLVFVEVLKELPATMILRPFDLETLATRAHAYASDERLGAAAWPALLIVAAGLPAVIWISRGLDTARPGAR